jgi:4-amino-4-deoxy-L-arabinose transferase-like glycosyltransferase
MLDLMNTNFSRILQSRWLDSLWFLAISAYILAGVALVPLHGDEATQVYMGRDFYYQFVQGDIETVMFRDWEMLDGEAATQQELRLLNGTIPKYLFGAAAFFSGYSIDEINEQWAWGSGWQWNQDNGHVPTGDLLLRTRIISAIMLALSAIALFFVGDALGGRRVAYLASAYYVLNPAILLNGRRAMMESAMMLFSILLVLIALWLLKKRAWLLYILLGLVSGLAVASKHTSIATVAAVFVICGGYLLVTSIRKRELVIKSIGAISSAGVISLLVFFALNPAWWSNPLRRVSDVLRLRQDLLNGQVGFFGGYEHIGEQIGGFLRQTLLVLPIYAESDFDGFLSEQADVISIYDSSLLSGISIGGSIIGAAIFGLIIIMGLVALWRYSALENSSSWLIGGWFVAMILLTLLLTPLEWQRYYIPIYPTLGLIAALGIDYSWYMVKQWRT